MTPAKSLRTHFRQRRGLYPHQPRTIRRRDPQTGLLKHFASQRVDKAFAILHAAAGADPYARAGAGAMLSEQNPVPGHQ